MPLVTLSEAQLAFGDLPLLDRAALVLDAGERVGLIGRNGSGKSSLLAVIAGRQALDAGSLVLRDGLRAVLVEQVPSLPHAPTLRQSLLLRAMPAIHAHLQDDRERWRFEARLDEFLDRFALDASRRPADASGGEQKRAALALAFALDPELLLLDEPTNHLDIEGIERLEGLLARPAATIVVTHDRRFLDATATRIVELDRGVLRSTPGNFSVYERRKAVELEVEATAQRRFDRFWREEEAWIRKGIEARRTRNEGRVRRLERLRSERAARRDALGQVKLAIGTGERSGKRVAELSGVSKSFGARPIVRGLDLVVSRGDRIAFIGPNGAGKTTLIRLLLGTLAPDAGSVRLGTRLGIAYFDQLRTGLGDALDPERTVADTIAPGSDWVELPSGRRHVMSYLADFLFPPRRAATPVRMLSGGERNRLLLARLFARPANLLVLDEPTNDLDIDTLELLEAALQDYDGTVLLVSHDRAFVDNVVTQTLVAQGDGRWIEYAGGYSDWLRQRPPDAAPRPDPGRTAASPPRGDPATGMPASPPPGRQVKLSYRETRALAALPAEIDALEAEQRMLDARMHEADYFRQPAEVLREDRRRYDEIDALLIERLEQWEALEAKAKAAEGAARG